MTAGRGPDAGKPPLHVAFLLLQNFTLIPFAGFIDMLRLAADEGDRSRPHACRWTILAPSPEPVRASCGISVAPWGKLGDPAAYDHIVVVGGLLPPPGKPMLDKACLAFLTAAHRARRSIIGVCTGSFALIEAGLVGAGGKCCISWYHHQDLVERHPDVIPVSDRLWVRSGLVTTCAGGTATIDLAAALIREHVGSAASQKSLHILVAAGQRESGTAQPHPPIAVRARDPRVRRAVLLMEQHLSMPLDGDELADRLTISRRQLERLFRRDFNASLQVFARDLRLSYALWQLAHSEARITDIAGQCGFSDTAHLDRCFHKAFGTSPSRAKRLGTAELKRLLASWWPYGEPEAEEPLPPGGEALTDRRHFP